MPFEERKKLFIDSQEWNKVIRKRKDHLLENQLTEKNIQSEIDNAGILAGLTSIAFGTAEIQEGLGYGNWLKSIGITGNLYNGLYIESNIASSLATIGWNIYRNSRITSGTGQANKTGKAYSRYYQMKDDKVVSITHYGKGGYRNYRIDLVGRTHNVALPHKHNYYVYNEYLNKGPIDKIDYILWLLMGNWR